MIGFVGQTVGQLPTFGLMGVFVSCYMVVSCGSRGARIRTGDLLDPNQALYRAEPRPANLREQISGFKD